MFLNEALNLVMTSLASKNVTCHNDAINIVKFYFFCIQRILNRSFAFIQRAVCRSM